MGELFHDRSHHSRAARGSLHNRIRKFDGKPYRRAWHWPGQLLEAAAHTRVAGEGDSLGAVGGAKLEQNRRYVVLHRLDADAHSG